MIWMIELLVAISVLGLLMARQASRYLWRVALAILLAG